MLQKLRMFVLTRRLQCEVILKGKIRSNFFLPMINSVHINTCNKLYHKESINSLEINEIIKEENINNCIERLRNLVVPRSVNTESLKAAAVLIPLCIKCNEISLLFTLRKGDLRQHKGQVSFPGGVQDAGEDLIETALRETEEELGIDRKCVNVWGHGNRVETIEYSVLPVIGFIGDISEININPNPDEVECVFTVPLSHFCDKNNCKYTRFRYKRGGNFLMPAYINVPCRIWGLTATLTHIFLMSLIPSEYQHRLPIVKTKS